MKKTAQTKIHNILMTNREILGDIVFLLQYKNKKDSFFAIFRNKKGYYATNLILTESNYTLLSTKIDVYDNLEDLRIGSILLYIKKYFKKEEHELIIDDVYFKQFYL